METLLLSMGNLIKCHLVWWLRSLHVTTRSQDLIQSLGQPGGEQLRCGLQGCKHCASELQMLRLLKLSSKVIKRQSSSHYHFVIRIDFNSLDLQLYRCLSKVSIFRLHLLYHNIFLKAAPFGMQSLPFRKP